MMVWWRQTRTSMTQHSRTQTWSTLDLFPYWQVDLLTKGLKRKNMSDPFMIIGFRSGIGGEVPRASIHSESTLAADCD